MDERDDYAALLMELQQQVEDLKADPRSTSYEELLHFLDRLVKQSRHAGKKLEMSGRHSQSLAFYELIVDAYRTARRLVPRRERAAFSEMAGFWESVLDGKRRMAQMSKRVQRPAEFETAHASHAGLESSSRGLYGPNPVEQVRRRQAQMAPSAQGRRQAQRNSFLKKPK